MQRRNVKFEKISMIQNVTILQLLNFDKKHHSDELPHGVSELPNLPDLWSGSDGVNMRP